LGFRLTGNCQRRTCEVIGQSIGIRPSEHEDDLLAKIITSEKTIGVGENTRKLGPVVKVIAREVAKSSHLRNKGVSEGPNAQFLVDRRRVLRVPNEVIKYLLFNATLCVAEGQGEQEEGQEYKRDDGEH
jgi:hypothetical protein